MIVSEPSNNNASKEDKEKTEVTEAEPKKEEPKKSFFANIFKKKDAPSASDPTELKYNEGERFPFLYFYES